MPFHSNDELNEGQKMEVEPISGRFCSQLIVEQIEVMKQLFLQRSKCISWEFSLISTCPYELHVKVDLCMSRWIYAQFQLHS